MKSFTVRLSIALITFLIGTVVFVAWFFLDSNYSNFSNSYPLEPIIQADEINWSKDTLKHIHVETLVECERLANLARLSVLRLSSLPPGDLEVRVWRGFGLIPVEGLVLKRNAGQWSAHNLKADMYYQPRKVTRKELNPPASGWEDCWQKLVKAGILVLPSSDDFPFPDAEGYVVEVRDGGSYRSYNYVAPEYSNQSEAKRMIEIGDIISKEFDLSRFEAKRD